MIVLGLTGSIAMGKSTAAAMFRRFGVPVFDADRAVHRLLAPGGAAIAAVATAFPGCVGNAAIDRGALAACVFADAAALQRLERLLHPLVFEQVEAFLRRSRREGRRLVVLDVPLLFETGGDGWCDLVAVVSAPARVQAERLARRPDHTQRRLAGVLDRQLPDAMKRRRADVVIPTGLGRAVTMRIIGALVTSLTVGSRSPAPQLMRMLTRRATKYMIQTCGKLFSIRRRPGLTRTPAIAWSRSAASNC